MDEDLKEKFVLKLEEKYGTWTKITSKFGTTSFGAIAKDLSISASQFSKLIYGSATEGMYLRSIANIDQLLRHDLTRKKLEQALAKNDEYEAKLKETRTKKSSLFKNLRYAIIGLMVGAITMYFWHAKFSDDQQGNSSEHPLVDYFDQGFEEAFDTPYLEESEVQDNCPCSAYEGEWSLEEQFKLPLPGSRRPGLYYLAKKSDMRMRCSSLNAALVGTGKAVIGYEYLVSEIWMDKEQEPLIPKYFDVESKAYTPAFDSLRFSEDERFERVAVLHAFNVNNFEIHPDSIIRKAELTGRYVTDLDKDLAKEYEIDIKHIVENVLGNLTQTNCVPASNPYCDPNDLVAGESVIGFDCMYTIESENLGLGGGYPYNKSFRLQKQHYSDHLNCECDASE